MNTNIIQPIDRITVNKICSGQVWQDFGINISRKFSLSILMMKYEILGCSKLSYGC